MRTKGKLTSKQGRALTILVENPNFPIGSILTVKDQNKRTLRQNRFYWAWITWVFMNGICEQTGRFSKEGFHEDLKAYFLSENIVEKGIIIAIEEGSTTDLDTKEFGQFMDKADIFVNSFFGINTAPFWDRHEGLSEEYGIRRRCE